MNFNEQIKATVKRFEERKPDRDKTLSLLQENKVIEANDPDLVQRRIARLNANPLVVDAIRKAGMSFERSVPGISSMNYTRGLERVIGTNNLLGIGFLARGLTVARAVAKIHIVAPQGNGFGTGFLVSPRLLLTNHHVLESKAIAVNSEVEFNYQLGPGNESSHSYRYKLAPDEFFLTNQLLDYTLVRVREIESGPNFGWLPLIESTGKLLVGEKVNIIQHPNGEPKQAALRENKVVDELELFLHYETDTAPGSSGSPVFNDQWEVVALHHSGVPKKHPTEDYLLTSDGQRWEPSMGEQRLAWVANEGVRVSRLVADIKKQDLDAKGKQLRDELFGNPPVSLPSNLPQPLVHAHDSDFFGNTPGVLFEQSTHGVATWTMPLTIRVSLGSPNLTPQVDTTATEGLFGGNSQTVSHRLPPFAVSSLRQNGFDWRAALSLAMASDLVYAEDSKLIQSTVRGWGFNECHFIQKDRTECLIARIENLVLIVFRGTQGLRDWLSNLDLLPMKLPMGRVHRGFHEQFATVQASIEAIVHADSNTEIMLAGHSLGGAIATIAAAKWNKTYRIKALYTFGQPAVGNDVFADSMGNNYQSNYYRFVNDADVVARVPPGYTHAGQLYHFNSKGILTVAASESGFVLTESTSKTLSLEEFLALQENLRDAQRQEAFGTWISDHSIKLYIQRIANHINSPD